MVNAHVGSIATRHPSEPSIDWIIFLSWELIVRPLLSSYLRRAALRDQENNAVSDMLLPSVRLRQLKLRYAADGGERPCSMSDLTNLRDTRNEIKESGRKTSDLSSGKGKISLIC